MFPLAMAGPSSILSDLPRHVRKAVRFYWRTRAEQLEKQAGSGAKDQGLRSAVTGGAQMDGFIELLTKLGVEAGANRSHIYCKESLEPASDLNFQKFAQSLVAQVAAFSGRIKQL